ncbi:MAG: hypothetical protein V7K43_19175 [Nostoc sp.]
MSLNPSFKNQQESHLYIYSSFQVDEVQNAGFTHQTQRVSTSCLQTCSFVLHVKENCCMSAEAI